jgi:hypothetical protein
MLIHCIRCGQNEMLRRGRNGAAESSLTAYERMESDIRNSFLKTCPKLCSSCLSDLFHFVHSPEHEKLFERRLHIRLPRAG